MDLQCVEAVQDEVGRKPLGAIRTVAVETVWGRWAGKEERRRYIWTEILEAWLREICETRY